MAWPLRMLKHPTGLGLALTIAAAAVGATLFVRGDRPATATARPTSRIEVPLRPVARAGADRVVVTLRWGHPSRKRSHRKAPTPARWDGYLALDCGTIDRVEALDLEPTRADEAAQAGDRIGPVVRGDGGEQRVYWRSHTDDDADGLKATVSACRPDPHGGDSSTLRIVTPRKTYLARLDWSVDDFVSMPVGEDGSTLDVHISAGKDYRAVRGARITELQVAPDAGKAAAGKEMAAEGVPPPADGGEPL